MSNFIGTYGASYFATWLGDVGEEAEARLAFLGITFESGIVSFDMFESGRVSGDLFQSGVTGGRPVFETGVVSRAEFIPVRQLRGNFRSGRVRS